MTPNRCPPSGPSCGRNRFGGLTGRSGGRIVPNAIEPAVDAPHEVEVRQLVVQHQHHEVRVVDVYVPAEEPRGDPRVSEDRVDVAGLREDEGEDPLVELVVVVDPLLDVLAVQVAN